MDPWELVATERAALVDLLDTLEPDQWRMQSLCPDWTVHEVVAHLVSVLEAGPLGLARAAVVGLGSPPRMMRVLASRWADRTPDQLVAGLRGRIGSRFAPPVLGYRSALTDVMVHRLDIAVPLGLEAPRPPESWRPVLDFLTAGIPLMGSIRPRRPGLTWRTTDLDWSAGKGPLVTGPADAVGMTIAGRDALLDRLQGDGVPRAEAWLHR